MRTWQKRHHTKRRSYAPNAEWIVGQLKHGEPTMKDCFNLEQDDAFALRDMADEQGLHLSDVLVDALQVGTIGTSEERGVLQLQELVDEARQRYELQRRRTREAAYKSSDSELRWSRTRRRERATHTWAAQVRRLLSDADHQRLQDLDDQVKQHVGIFVDVDHVKSDLGTVVVQHAGALGELQSIQSIGQRIPASIHAALRAEVVQARRAGDEVKVADVVRGRVRRFLAMHGRLPQIRHLTIQLREFRVRTAALRAREREHLRLARQFQIRRQRIKRRLDFVLGRRMLSRRMPTEGERAAMVEHDQDPDALDIDDEMRRRETLARQQALVGAILTGHARSA